MSAEQIAKLQADLAAAQKTAKDATDALAAQRRQERHAEAVEFAEGLVGSERLLPRDQPLVVALLETIEGDTPIEFGEGDDKKSLGTAVRELLQTLPKHGLNSQHIATGARSPTADGDDELQFSEGAHIDPDRLDLHRRATALAKDKGIPYFEAARQLAQG